MKGNLQLSVKSRSPGVDSSALKCWYKRFYFSHSEYRTHSTPCPFAVL